MEDGRVQVNTNTVAVCVLITLIRDFSGCTSRGREGRGVESLSLSINCTLGTFCEPMMKKAYMYTCPSMIMIFHYIVLLQ